jgi:hypothetical protein
MTIDERLAAAAAGISSMPDTEISQGLAELHARRHARTRSDAARHAAELDSAELDWAAYELARHCEQEGDLGAAARWYRLCAAADLGDSALRLARVLDRRSRQRADGPRGGELVLVSDAARWYIEAYAAGHAEAAEELDQMIGHGELGHRDEQAPARPGCPCGGLDVVIEANDLAGATEHFQRCTACQSEFVGRGGLLASHAARPVTGTVLSATPGRAGDRDG